MYTYLTTGLTALGYVVGDASGEVTILDAFPFPNFISKLPAIAMDFEEYPRSTEYELGGSLVKSVSINLNIFERDNLRREKLTDDVRGLFEKKTLKILDYNQVTPDLIYKMRIVEIFANPIRVLEPGEKQKFRVSLDIETEIVV